MSSLEQQYYEHDAFWNPDTGPLNQIDQQRIKDIYKLVPSGVRSILDVGCGNGIFCNFVKQQNPALKIVGLDRSAGALRYVLTEKVRSEITDIPFPDKSFDCVTSLEVIEHLPLPIYRAALQEIARISRRYIIISVPNNQQLGHGQTECPECKSKFDPDLHVRSYNVPNMQSLFSDFGYRCQRVEAIGRLSFFRGVTAYSNYILSRLPPAMLSPVCPICGYENREFASTLELYFPQPRGESIPPRSSFPKSLIKKYWPKVVTYKWLMALYERT